MSIVHIELFNVEKAEGKGYNEYIVGVRSKLANYPGKTDVRGRPILPKQLVGKAPARWFYIKLSGEKEEDVATLAVRDDNLYLIAFQNKNGAWYEFNTPDQTYHFISESTFLGFGSDYPSMLPGGRKDLAKQDLGQTPAKQDVSTLAYYPEHKPSSSDEDKKKDAVEILKPALARVIVTINESLRLFLITKFVVDHWNVPGKVNQQHLNHIRHWKDMSTALMAWNRDPSRYVWPKNLIKDGIKDAYAALDAVALLLNSPPRTMHELEASDGMMHATAAEDVHGQPLVEVLAVRAGFDLNGMITVFDGMCAHNIYHKRDGEAHVSVNGPKDMIVMTGPHRAISACGNFSIELDLYDGDKLSELPKPIDFDVYDTDAKYNEPVSHAIDSPHGPVQVTYVVLGNAVQAVVQVKLVDLLGENPVHVYGTLTARSHVFDIGSILFANVSDDNVLVAAQQLIPLAKSVVAVPLKSPLIIEADLRTSAGEEIVKGNVTFYPELSGEHVKCISGDVSELEVKITWVDI